MERQWLWIVGLMTLKGLCILVNWLRSTNIISNFRIRTLLTFKHWFWTLKKDLKLLWITVKLKRFLTKFYISQKTFHPINFWYLSRISLSVAMVTYLKDPMDLSEQLMAAWRYTIADLPTLFLRKVCSTLPITRGCL